MKMTLVNYIMYDLQLSEQAIINSDVNQDGAVGVQDVVALVAHILGND